MFIPKYSKLSVKELMVNQMEMVNNMEGMRDIGSEGACMWAGDAAEVLMNKALFHKAHFEDYLSGNCLPS